MSENRKPNTICAICNKAIYRRPWEIEKCEKNYCSKTCMFYDRLLPEILCKECGKTFRQTTKTQKFCSKSCVGKSTRNRLGTKNVKRICRNSTEKRIHILKEKFNFTSCMVKNCGYNTTFDVHRLVSGKDGGKYEVGNMFAICPNHHAEHHRGFIKFEKENDFTLVIKGK